MTVLSKNPKQIHDGYKEAVVDSLLNNLSARLAGRGEFYGTIYGNKPAAVLMSEFIVPMPVDERVGDEEADPIQISAHGLDFQISTDSVQDKIAVSVTGAVYVRIIPTFEEVRPEGRLEIAFPPTKAVEQALRVQVKAALARRTHPDWPARSYAARKAVYETVGVPFDNTMDRTSGDAIESGSAVEGASSGTVPDGTVDGPAEGPSSPASAEGTGDAAGRSARECRTREGCHRAVRSPDCLPFGASRGARTGGSTAVSSVYVALSTGGGHHDGRTIPGALC